MSTDRTRSAAFFVGAGILLSRIAGLVRQKVFAHYFSTSLAADAFNAAFKIPNLLQNLFGEGVLSASFIPEYVGLISQKREAEANGLAGAVLSALALIASLLVLAGVLAAPYLVGLIAPGFTGERRELTVQLTQILFPGGRPAGVLRLASRHSQQPSPFFRELHRAGDVEYRDDRRPGRLRSGSPQAELAVILAWASVLGSGLQFLVQLPLVLKLARGLKANLDFQQATWRNVFRNFIPAFVSRGVVQISAYIDSFIASWLPNGSVATLAYAQVLYTLPVSLFGMAVTAAELPVMASAVGSTDEVASYLRGRLDGGLERIAFFIIPSAIAFLALGDMVSAVLFESGRFTQRDSIWVWQVLAGSTLGLLASTWARLYSSTFYALRDTRTPLKFAVIRVTLNCLLGYFAALHLPRMLAIDARFGVTALTAASGIAACIEFYMLRRAMNQRIGSTSIAPNHNLKLLLAGAVAAAAGWALKLGLSGVPRFWMGVVVLAAFGVVYLLVTTILGIREATALTAKLTRRLSR